MTPAPVISQSSPRVGQHVTLSLRLQNPAKFLGVAIAALHVANAVRLFLSWQTDRHRLWGFGPLFDVDGEGNVPALFSALMLFTAGCLAHQVATRARQRHLSDWRYWYGIAYVFVYLSIDEAVQLHELLMPVGRAVAGAGLFRGGWVLPFGAALVLLGVLYARMVLRMPRDLRTRGLCAATLYVGGALGMELMAGPLWQAGSEGYPFQICCAVEELLEMCGVAVWICALVRHLSAAPEAQRQPEGVKAWILNERKN